MLQMERRCNKEEPPISQPKQVLWSRPKIPLLEQFQRLYLEFVCLAQKESSSDCALFLFRCLIIFNIKPWLARPANLIQTIKPHTNYLSNITQREFGHVPAHLMFVRRCTGCVKECSHVPSYLLSASRTGSFPLASPLWRSTAS